MKAAALRNIRRMDDPSRSTHAWLVQVQRHKHIDVKMFSDSVLGGKRKALAAARQWRDEHMQPIGEYHHELWRRNTLRRNNGSGLVGIARYERTPLPSGKPSNGAFWLASWIAEHGISRKRKFSVRRWGEHGAKQMAIEAREQGVHHAVAVRTQWPDA
jgi:hypothetical protein